MNRMDAIEYFKGMRKVLCEEYLKGIPKDSVGYQATLIEMSFYDEAIKALEQKPCKDAISIQALKDLGAECIAKRDENGNFIPLGSIDSLPPVNQQEPKIDWDYGEIKDLTSKYHPAILNKYLDEDLCIKNPPSVSTENPNGCGDRLIDFFGEIEGLMNKYMSESEE